MDMVATNSTTCGVRLKYIKDYLGMCIHSTQAGPRADIPDANVSVTGASPCCQDIGLPRTPCYSLGGIKAGSTDP